MPRRTKEELRAVRTDKWLNELIQKNKFLREPKYYKNNYWSWAAWDSWAAQGKAGGCSGCGVGYYNGTLHNKRKNTDKGHGGKPAWLKNVSGNLCYDCVTKIEEKIKHKFERH